MRAGPEGCSERDDILLRSKPHRTTVAFRARFRGETQHQAQLEGCNDARTGMPSGIPKGAMCVQRFDDSLNSAIHITYRILLRSSSMPEPRDPLLKVLIDCISTRTSLMNRVKGSSGGHSTAPGRAPEANGERVPRPTKANADV